MRVVSFQTVNANDEGEYFSGLATVVPNTCRAEDDVTNAFGDPAEESIATALDFLAGRSCTAIAQEGVQGVASVRSRREALRPESPSAAQFEIPGLF